jgi:excisionase family DNA binding protein
MTSATTTTAPKDQQRRKPSLPRKWDGKAVFDVADFAEIFELNSWSVYDLIKRGQIRAVKIGRLVKIPRHVIEEMLEA